MSKGGFSLKIEPLTPLFFGARMSLDPYQFVSSRIIPNIYTIGGALLGLIASINNGDYVEVEDLILNGEIIVRGPYITVEYEGGIKYFIESPKNVIGDTRYKLKMDRNDDYGWMDLMGIYTPRIDFKPDFKPPEVEGAPFTEIVYDEARGRWGLNLSSYGYLIPTYSDRTSFRMDRDLRVVSQPSLYFRSMIEGYQFNSRMYGVSRRIYFTCDFQVPEEYSEKITGLDGKIIRLGGEGGLARVRIEAGETPILTASSERVVGNSEYLAVSHIPVIKVGDRLKVIGYGEAEWVFGEIELIGGWLIRSRRMKKHVSALTPGSIFKILRADEDTLDEWYFKLLNTAIKY